MKKATIFILAIFLSLSTFSQIVFENTYSSLGNLNLVHLTNGGYKYWQLLGNVYHLYNTDHSVYKTITLPFQASMRYYTSVDVPVSDNLFNNDSLIEVVYGIQDTSNYNLFSGSIVNENGLVLFTQSQGGITRILNIDGNYKMLVGVSDTTNFHLNTVDVYSLPGTIPCETCGTLSSINQFVSGSNQHSLNAYPNPTTEKIRINYSLKESNVGSIQIYSITGQLIKVYAVDRSFNNLEIDLQSLSKGSYMYILKDGSRIENGKFVIQ